MPRQVTILVLCDVCGADTGKDDRSKPIPVALGRRSVELDLCPEHDSLLTDSLAPFLEAGRRVGTGPVQVTTPRLNGDAERRAPEPHECEICHYWFRGAGIHAHQRGGCDGSPPPFTCPHEGCLAGYKDEAKVRVHLASGDHIIPTPAMRKAEKARQREAVSA
jgi:hypothetical protein